jgi:hypothetical protein
VLLSTTPFETLNERVLLVLDGDEFDISIMEMKPFLPPTVYSQTFNGCNKYSNIR